MMSSVDGKILTANWKGTSVAKSTGKLYETIHKKYDSQGWLCGRTTMERDFAKGLYTHKGNPVKTFQDHVADIEATSFAIAIDAHGKLAWESGDMDGDHLITVLSGQVSQAYLDYLEELGISYLFAGESEIDMEVALKKLADNFPIKTIMLEGGGHLNGQMMKAGLVDELSLLLLPLADGSVSTTLFEYGAVTELKLNEVEKLEHDVLWLKYKVL